MIGYRHYFHFYSTITSFCLVLLCFALEIGCICPGLAVHEKKSKLNETMSKKTVYLLRLIHVVAGIQSFEPNEIFDLKCLE